MDYAGDSFVELFEVKDMPFYFGLLDKKQLEESLLPRALPFSWGIDAKYGLLAQKNSAILENFLGKAYESEFVIAPPTGEGTFGEIAANAAIADIIGHYGSDFAGKRVLEIGCSNGYILNKLREKGAICTGLEPGPQGEIARNKYGLNVLRSTVEDAVFAEKFDIIYSNNVLEHISDLGALFSKTDSHMKNGGAFIAAVPDTRRQMRECTPSLFLHEHLWYFTPDAFSFFLAKRGYGRIKTTPASYDANFVISGTFSPGAVTETQLTEPLEELRKTAMEFLARLRNIFASMQGRIDRCYKDGTEICLYGCSNVPQLLGLLEWKAQPRVFDSDEIRCGKYVAGPAFSCLVEPPANLLEIPQKEIWILPIFHQYVIKTSLVKMGVGEGEIVLFADLLASIDAA